MESAKAGLGYAVSVVWNEEMEGRLRKVFKDAVDLFHVLHRQDARYFVDMAPAKGGTFSAAQMEELVDVEKAGGLNRRGTEVSVFPAVNK